MTPRQLLVDELMADEGTGPMRHGRHLPYLDCCGKFWRLCTCRNKGALTIGYGRNLDANGVTPSEAALLLEHNIDEAVTDLAGSFPWFRRLSALRQRVLTNLRFQLGGVRLRLFKRMLAALAEDDYPKAAHSLTHSLLARQAPGRTMRRARQLLTNEDDT